MTQFAIDVQGLTKIFDNRIAVDNVSLKVKKGSVFGFLGSNGSGKTTMIRMICGILTPSKGTGQCLGLDIETDRDVIKTKIGYMPQKFSLYSKLTVYENLRFFADVYQIDDHEKEIESILIELELMKYKDFFAANLSGGWKQRLTLACCLLHKPELLFLDEPTAGVDPKARKDFWNYLHKIAIRDGTTILVTTHYMDEAEKCTDLAYINLGKLLYSGTTKELVPFSKVKTYEVEGSRVDLNNLSALAEKTYPELLVSMVNNDLRVSSNNKKLLDKFIREEKLYKLKEVNPSFEEVFIGLMQE